MFISVKKSGFAAPLYDGDSGVTSGGGAPSDAGTPTANTTSSIIPGDNFASGGPEPAENEPAERIDFEGFDFDAEPDTDGGGEEGEPGTGDPGQDNDPETDPVPEPVKKEQSPEANAAFAEQRRQIEQFKKEQAERDQWVEQNFGQSHNLHTWQEYQQAVEKTNQMQAEQRRQEMQTRPQQVAQEVYQRMIQDGYDEEMARREANREGALVAQSLQIEALQAEIIGVKSQTEQEKQAALQREQQQTEQAMVEKGTQMILGDYDRLKADYGDLLPDIQGETPVQKLQSLIDQLDPETVARLNKGYTFEDAWYIANKSTLMDRKEKAAAQKTLNNLDSKKHLKTEGDGAGDSNTSSIPLSPDTLAMYMDSGMTEKQARAFHHKLYG
ncbi:MAG: hypothetical protein ACM3PP_02485 [Candidatus Saccharibacteria bacterium]